MNRYTRLFAFALLCIFSISAEIVKTDSLEVVLQYINPHKNTFVAFDLDNTLVEPDNATGWSSDQWIYAHVNHLINQGIVPDQAWKIVFPFYYETQFINGYKLRTVEECTVSLIKKTQEVADKVIGLTSRSRQIADITIRLLEDIGIVFSFQAADKFEFDHTRAVYSHGVYFCGWQSKGEALLALFEHLHYWPEVVVFVDDKMSHVVAVESVLQDKGIKVYGIHYTKLALKKDQFQLPPDLLD